MTNVHIAVFDFQLRGVKTRNYIIFEHGFSSYKVGKNLDTSMKVCVLLASETD